MLRDLLVCERRLGLDLHGDPLRRDDTSPFVKMLWANGSAHKNAILSTMAADAVDLRGASEEDRERGTCAAVAGRAPLILGAIVHDGDLIGAPDALALTERGYVAVDVRAGSALDGPDGAYKKEYLVQSAHHALLVAGLGWGPGDVAAIIDARSERFEYDLSRPIGRDRLDGTTRHLRLLEDARAVRDRRSETRGAMSAMCSLCDWRTFCRSEMTQADDLTRIAGLGRALRDGIEPIAATVAELARLPRPAPDRATGVPGIGAERLARFIDRARLIADPAAGPVAREPLGLPDNPHAIDFDVEADPVRDIVYLHGFWHEEAGPGSGRFVHFFAETPDLEGERDAFAQAVAHFRRHRDAHWFHYSAYERTAYRALQRRHPEVCDEDEIEAIFHPSRCTDLYAIIARRTDWPLSSYSIKSIAKSCGFSWEDVDPSGAASVEWYDRYVRTRDEALRDRIVVYNRDDVRASARVREALGELDLTGRIDGFRRRG